MKWRKAAIVFFALALTPGARAFEFAAGRANGLAGAPVLTDASAVTAVWLPAVPVDRGNWRIELGGVRRYNLSELDEFYAAGAYRQGRGQVAVGVSQFGRADLYREIRLAVGVGWHTKLASVGVSGTSCHVAFGGGYVGLDAFSIGIYGGTGFGHTRVVIGVDNVNRPSYGEGTPAINRVYTLLTEYRYRNGQTVTGRGRFEKDRKPQFGLGHRFEVGRSAALFWGLSSEPLTFGGGVDIMYENVRLTYVASYHPVLGMMHTASAAWSGE